MRSRLLWLCLVLVGLAAGSGAHAQTPPDKLIQGQVLGTSATASGGWCYVTTGASTLQIGAGLPTTGVVTFPELVYYDGSYHDLSGQGRMVFTSGTGGTIRFKLWPKTNISGPPFNSFSSTAYSGGQYIVTFNIVFPSGCTLAIYGNYESP
jgi:hypothetical protein